MTINGSLLAIRTTKKRVKESIYSSCSICSSMKYVQKTQHHNCYVTDKNILEFLHRITPVRRKYTIERFLYIQINT